MIYSGAYLEGFIDDIRSSTVHSKEDDIEALVRTSIASTGGVVEYSSSLVVPVYRGPMTSSSDSRVARGHRDARPHDTSGEGQVWGTETEEADA